jgi:hypothetical protein
MTNVLFLDFFFPLDLARPYGTRVVYLQVSSVASEDAASQIKSVSVILTPGQFRTTTYAGPALQGILDRAQQQGYGPLKLKSYKVIPDPQCSQGGTPALVPDMRLTPLWPDQHSLTLTEKAEFRAFAGPPLMPFWKITDLGFNTVVIPASGGWTIAVGGYNMVNTPGQPPIQDPERIIRVERTTRFDYAMKPVCIVGTELPSTLLPGFRSVTVVGPDGRDPREAFPPRGPTAGGPLELRPGIPPGIGPIRP